MFMERNNEFRQVDRFERQVQRKQKIYATIAILKTERLTSYSLANYLKDSRPEDQSVLPRDWLVCVLWLRDWMIVNAKWLWLPSVVRFAFAIIQIVIRISWITSHQSPDVSAEA
jgi:hypothetical protein